MLAPEDLALHIRDGGALNGPAQGRNVRIRWNVGILRGLRYTEQVIHARPFPGVRNSSEMTFPEFSSSLMQFCRAERKEYKWLQGLPQTGPILSPKLVRTSKPSPR